MHVSINVVIHIFVIGFGRSQLCPYEASCKFYYLRTHCALHYFIFFAMTASFKSLITRRILNKRYSYSYALKLKHLYSYIQTDSNHVCLHICVRIFIGSTIRLLKVKHIHAFLFRNGVKWSRTQTDSYPNRLILHLSGDKHDIWIVNKKISC